jgi:hypothetical protein
MADQPKAKAGNPNWVSEKPNSASTLAEQGIDKNLADRARKADTKALLTVNMMWSKCHSTGRGGQKWPI